MRICREKDRIFVAETFPHTDEMPKNQCQEIPVIFVVNGTMVFVWSAAGCVYFTHKPQHRPSQAMIARIKLSDILTSVL